MAIRWYTRSKEFGVKLEDAAATQRNCELAHYQLRTCNRALLSERSATIAGRFATASRLRGFAFSQVRGVAVALSRSRASSQSRGVAVAISSLSLLCVVLYSF